MKKIIYILIVLGFLGGVVFLIMTPGKAGKYDTFAQCVKDNGVKFFGAFWCPHCQAQKARFSKSASKLPYIECSNPDGQTQTQICKDLGITTYPTWEFLVMSTTTNATSTERVLGELELTDIAKRTGCQLPDNI